eukprot:5630103-Pyramimonas_sp.AAC.1
MPMARAMANLLQRGSAPSDKPVVHMIDAHCKALLAGPLKLLSRNTCSSPQLGGLLSHDCVSARTPCMSTDTHLVKIYTGVGWPEH